MLPPDMIKSITDEILTKVSGKQTDEASLEKRMASMYQTYQSFADDYPTMYRLCCGAVTGELRERFVHFRDVMLQQVNAIQENTTSTEDAGKRVGTVLGHQYLPKNIMEEFGYDSKRPAKKPRSDSASI
jgi:hypothetical protein